MDRLIFNLFVDWVDKIRWLNIVMKFEFENFFIIVKKFVMNIVWTNYFYMKKQNIVNNNN
jgi:hypothetical protein